MSKLGAIGAGTACWGSTSSFGRLLEGRTGRRMSEDLVSSPRGRIRALETRAASLGWKAWKGRPRQGPARRDRGLVSGMAEQFDRGSRPARTGKGFVPRGSRRVLPKTVPTGSAGEVRSEDPYEG